MRKIHLVAAIALAAASATTASAQMSMEGSDTLEFVMRDIIEACEATAFDTEGDDNFEITVLAGGTGTGEDAMERDSGENTTAGIAQQIAHMSRALDANACNDTNVIPSLVLDQQQIAVALDKILVLGGNCDNGDAQESLLTADDDDGSTVGCPVVAGEQYECVNNICSKPCDTNADCAGFYTTGSTPLTCDDGFCEVPTTNCELNTRLGDDAADWRAPLRTLYFGDLNANPALQNCNTAARQQLAADCNLYHVYRRDDASGTTNVFKTLLGVAATYPFCNSPGVTAPNSATSENEKNDQDPIRRACDQNEDVCSCDGTLGLILPISVPAVAEEFALNVLYPDRPCANALGLVTGSLGGLEPDSSNSAVVPPTRFGAAVSNTCPAGHARLVGGCIYPRANAANGSTAACMYTNRPQNVAGNALLSALRNTLPAGGNSLGCPVAGTAHDDRAFNLDVRNANGRLLSANSGADWVGHAFYRIHAWDGGDNAQCDTTAPIGADQGACANATVPDPDGTGTILTMPGCQKLSATEQIGCLVARDAAHMKRSTGFAGLQAVQYPASVPSVYPATNPVSEVANAITVDGQGFRNGDLSVDPYNFARKLYVNTLIGVTNMVDNKRNGGDERSLANCIVANPGNLVGTAAQANGYEALPGGVITPTVPACGAPAAPAVP